MSIAEKLVTIAENEQKVYEAGQLKTLQDSEYMNAKVSGTTIAVNDVSPIEHNVGCKLSSKNLIPFNERTTVHNGVTFKVNSDGTVTANGTATASTAFKFGPVFLKGGTPYCISSGVDGSDTTYQMWAKSEEGVFKTIYNIENGSTFTPTADGTITAYICIYPGISVNDLVYKPMLNEGNTATEYTPYVADFSGIEVSRMSANLIPFPYADGGSGTVKEATGVKWTVNNDGSITVSGTPTGFSGFNLTQTAPIQKGTFVISVEGSNMVNIMLRIIISDGNGTTIFDKSFLPSENVLLTETNIGEGVAYRLYAYQKNNGNEMSGTFKVMLNKGSTALPYEPYIEPTTHQSTADGTVEGIKSTSPNMTLLTNNNGVIIDANYLRDIDTYINNLKAL